MYKFEKSVLEEGEVGVCCCGQELYDGELIMLYPEGDLHLFVCLTCHFWLVHYEYSD